MLILDGCSKAGKRMKKKTTKMNVEIQTYTHTHTSSSKNYNWSLTLSHSHALTRKRRTDRIVSFIHSVILGNFFVTRQQYTAIAYLQKKITTLILPVCVFVCAFYFSFVQDKYIYLVHMWHFFLLFYRNTQL